MSKKSPSKKRKIKVIITEDQKIFRQALRSYLEEEKIDVIAEAENGKVLLEQLFTKKLKPDVVVLDLEMPVMDGGEALVAIRKVDKNLKIVMLTYIDNKDVIQEMKRNGVNAFLDKNNELDDVVDVIRQLYDEIEFTNLADDIKPKFTKLEQEII
ncbi:MAG: response regulator transcription factor, partial [Bacteroidia bacterium]|nr:response regulator transcription factor [Bacteroidia bacterium]